MSSEYPEEDSSNHFEFRTCDKSLAPLLNTLKEHLSRTILIISSKGIVINTYDTSRSIFINLFLNAESFDHYYYKACLNDKGEEVSMQICINVHYLNNVLKTITSSDDIIKWGYNPQEEYLKITIISSARAEERLYKIVVQDSEDVCLEKHTTADYKYILTMPSGDLSAIFKHLKQLVVEKVKIKYVGMNLIFEAVSKTGTEICIRREGSKGPETTDFDKLIINKEPEHVSCYYDEFKFEYLYNFTKCAKISGKTGGSTVLLYLSEDEPLAIQFNVGKLGTVIYYLGSNQEDIQ